MLEPGAFKLLEDEAHQWRRELSKALEDYYTQESNAWYSSRPSAKQQVEQLWYRDFATHDSNGNLRELDAMSTAMQEARTRRRFNFFLPRNVAASTRGLCRRPLLLGNETRFALSIDGFAACGVEQMVHQRGGGCIVYSLGSNNAFDFEEAVLRETNNCTVHTFDCTSEPPKRSLGPRFSFHKTCVGQSTKGMEHAFKPLSRIMQELGHERISIIKWDVEGFEYDIFRDVLSEGSLHSRLPREILFELHYRAHMRARPPWWAREKTAGEIAMLATDLYDAGYRVISSHPNRGCPSCFEYTLLRITCPQSTRDALSERPPGESRGGDGGQHQQAQLGVSGHAHTHGHGAAMAMRPATSTVAGLGRSSMIGSATIGLAGHAVEVASHRVEVLVENSVYRMGDIVYQRDGWSPLRWHRDALRVMNDSETYGSSLLYSLLNHTLPRARVPEACLTHRWDLCDSGCSIPWPAPDTSLRVLAGLIDAMHQRGECGPDAGSDTLAVHLRLGDSDPWTEDGPRGHALEAALAGSAKWARSIARAAAERHARRVEVNVVLHFAPYHSEDANLRPSGKSAINLFNYSAAKETRAAALLDHILASLSRELGVAPTVRSSRDPDVSLCHLVAAAHFVPSVGGFGQLVQDLRKCLRPNSMRSIAWPPARGSCRASPVPQGPPLSHPCVLGRPDPLDHD